MNAQTLRTFLPTLQEELVLNHYYESDNRYSVLAMLAKREGTLILWEITSGLDCEKDKHSRRYRRPKTNRQSMKENTGGMNSLMIKAIELDGKRFEVSSATGTCLGDECNEEERVQLIYFLQKGVRLGSLEEVPLGQLYLNCYELSESGTQQAGLQKTENSRQDNATSDNSEQNIPDSSIPPLSLSQSTIKVELSEQHISVIVNKRITLKTGEYSKPRLVTVKGEEDVPIYIHGVVFYDIWEEAKTRFDDERYKERFSAEELERIKKDYMANLPQVCPQGCVIPLVEYESEKDYQVQFYSMEYLRRKPENRSTSVLMVFRPNQKIGPMGYRNRACALEAVKKGYEGSITAELFSYYKRVPGETVSCKQL